MNTIISFWIIVPSNISIGSLVFNHFRVIVNIVFNLLLNTKKDLEWLKEDPLEFTKQDQDIASIRVKLKSYMF